MRSTSLLKCTKRPRTICGLFWVRSTTSKKQTFRTGSRCLRRKTTRWTVRLTPHRSVDCRAHPACARVSLTPGRDWTKPYRRVALFKQHRNALAPSKHQAKRRTRWTHRSTAAAVVTLLLRFLRRRIQTRWTCQTIVPAAGLVAKQKNLFSRLRQWNKLNKICSLTSRSREKASKQPKQLLNPRSKLTLITRTC